MKNKGRVIFFAGLLAGMGLLLALSIVMLVSVPRESPQSQQVMKNMRGLTKLQGKASGGALPLSTFSSYDQVHGTRLYYMASQLPSVSANQLVTPSDFEQLQIAAEKQLEVLIQEQEVSCWWGLLRYLLVVIGIIIAPILAKLLANITDDFIYPTYKDAILKRIKQHKGAN